MVLCLAPYSWWTSCESYVWLSLIEVGFDAYYSVNYK